ncbi:protein DETOXIFICATION 16 isoform X1 [Cryptomeria japonica]|uniref:protein DETOXIFICATION 16 isoform X1 n=1 Tax=Cryptomeria japonica TaxID=3369 RepID=UPI0027DA430D|nr:protein DETOXIFICATION 16 isoform X1 [Cryptomeria japonica]XP_059072597.1 protein DETOXIFICATION 16 isoform X1 [Cryptomeria japonica]
METGDSIHSHGHENYMLHPLLAKEDTVVFEDEQDEWKCSKGLVWEEVKKQCWIAGPMASVNLLQISLRLISVMMVGHLGELALSGASIASSFAGVSGFSLLMGMGSALETLCGQAYGAKQYHLLGIHVQRAIFTLFCVSIPLAVVWAYMGNILIAFGQNPLISFEAGKFARWMIPSLFAHAALQPLVKFLQSQSIVFPMMLCSAITLCFHVPICWALVFKTGLGSKGAALATSVSNWLNVALLLLCIKISPACKRTWTYFSREALHNIKDFLKLAIPSSVMLCLEKWSFEMLVLFSGLLPNPKLETSVLSICISTNALVFMIPLGFGAAVSTRVSNELGAGHSHAARLAVYVVFFMAITEAVMIGCLLFSIRNVWGSAYSDEKEVINYVASMLPLVAVSSILDGIQGVLSGVARGCGWQKFGAYANLGAYYMVGIPVAVLLAYVLHFGGRGLWLGLTCGISVQSILLFLMTSCTDWEQQARKARERVYTSALPIVTEDTIKSFGRNLKS